MFLKRAALRWGMLPPSGGSNEGLRVGTLARRTLYSEHRHSFNGPPNHSANSQGEPKVTAFDPEFPRISKDREVDSLVNGVGIVN